MKLPAIGSLAIVLAASGCATSSSLDDRDTELTPDAGGSGGSGGSGGGSSDAGVESGQLHEGTWTSTSTEGAPGPRHLHTAVWSGSQLLIWGGTHLIDESLPAGLENTGAAYAPDQDSWSSLPTAGAPSPRRSHAAVWTGETMLLWGGYSGDPMAGASWDPKAALWAPLATDAAPGFRWNHSAVWSGAEMIVWGGTGATGIISSGGRYDLGADSWLATKLAPFGADGHTAIWTGSEMIVWGGTQSDLTPPRPYDRGLRYDPQTDAFAWLYNSQHIGAPSARRQHTAVWTGKEMIIWGGTSTDAADGALESGGRYDPELDEWRAMSTDGAPEARFEHTAVWTGSEMIVWGGVGASGLLASGGRYDPVSNRWRPLLETGAPEARRAHSAVWTGTEMIVWGGVADVPLQSGGRFTP